MPHIVQMPPHLADLIAAGEVVERPASVVKELVENSIDAGASAIAVETRGGGNSLIRVADNGCGIAPSELVTAFQRHATSKIQSADDLGHIGTLGFRGEALAAIAAVSRIEIISQQAGASEGAALHLEGGVPGAVESVGTSDGTIIQVMDLFFNTPARRKFMRKDSAETAAINGLMQHLSLSHPEVSFKYVKEGVETLHTPGDGKTDSAVYAALGREFALELVPVQGRGSNVAVQGFVSKPLFGRGSRGMQIFFVNGRFVKSQLLTAALEEGYRNQIMKGKFPGCVLFVTLPPSAVDVNVHPAKTIVKLANEGEVFDAVYHTVLNGLDNAGPISSPEPAAPKQDGNYFQTMDAETYRTRGAKPLGKSVAPRPAQKAAFYSAPRAPVSRKKIAAVQQLLSSGQQNTLPVSNTRTVSPLPDSADAAPNVSPSPAAPEVPEPVQPVQETFQSSAAPWRIAGEVLRTYIVCEAEDGTVYLIDKHAAHERIQFDHLQMSGTPVMAQTLLKPIPAELSREDSELLLEHLPELKEFGFVCEDFGDGTILVRAIPSDIEADSVVPVLEEFAAALRSGRSREEQRESLLRTIACKSAIKGGMESDEQELRILVNRVQSGEIRYCPHGRPVAVKLSRRQIEKMFKRA